MLGLAQRLAIRAARLDQWADRRSFARSRIVVLAYLPLIVLPYIVLQPDSSGLRLNLALGLSIVLGIGTVYALPTYGKKLLKMPTQAQTMAAALELLDATASHLSPQRLSDARLLMDVEFPQEAMKVVLQELAQAEVGLSAGERRLIENTVPFISQDPEAKALLHSLSITR